MARFVQDQAELARIYFDILLQMTAATRLTTIPIPMTTTDVSNNRFARF
jgi:hypothetical protein